MKIFKNFEASVDAIWDSVVAIGNFDGVHLGHQEIVKSALASRHAGQKAGVLTFYPHPAETFSDGFRYIMSIEDRLAKLAGMGLDFAIVLEFNQDFAQVTAKDFIENILLGKLKVAKVLTGSNFYFGHKRGGSAKLLSEYARHGYFDYQMLDVVNYKYKNVSSSVIKELLKNGRLIRANDLLGSPFYISGKVEKGSGRASEFLKTPTANITPSSKTNVYPSDFKNWGRQTSRNRNSSCMKDTFLSLPSCPLPNSRTTLGILPKYGVYFIRCEVDGEKKFGMANVGIRPTVGGKQPMLEVHLFDFVGNLYDKHLKVEFLSFLRPEYNFAGLEDLRAQLSWDERSCRYLLRNITELIK